MLAFAKQLKNYANGYIQMSVGKIWMLDGLVSTHPDLYAFGPIKAAAKHDL